MSTRGTLRLMSSPLTPDEQAALEELLPADQRTGDLADDLAAAARTAMARRVRNSELGGAVIAALYRELQSRHPKGSWRDLEAATGIPHGTARRWAKPPRTVQQDS